MSSLFKGWFGLWAACFTFFAYLQLNDPDPIIWTSWYLLTAAFSVAQITIPFPKWIIAIFILINLTWAYIQWPPQFEGFEQTIPHNMNIELIRETGGLILIALFAAVCLAIPRKKHP
jgi:hypothetical protein